MMSDQLTLFSNRSNPLPAGEQLNLDHSDIRIYRHFFDEAASNQLFETLTQEINWRQEYMKIHGLAHPIPRLTAWHGDEGSSYSYSGIEMHPEPWTDTLQFIKQAIESIAQVQFNSVLLNFYRDGNDSVGWHSDNEPELGNYPVIGSVSLGGTRKFSFKPKQKARSSDKYDIDLSNGDVLLMQGETQQYWYHQIPKTKKSVAPRINLTFRVIYL